MAGITIRAATLDDARAVQRIAHAGWRAAYGDFLSETVIERARREWHTEEAFRNLAARADAPFFVAEDGSAVVGYASGDISEDEGGLVGTLYVDPDRWGDGHASEASVSTEDEHSESSGGIGTALFERVLDALRERGVTRVTIRVFAENEVGRSFYESRGFTVAEEHEDDLFGETVPAVTYANEV